jgi:hypothetical protein
MTGSNWRLRNNGGRQDLMLPTYQIRRCNTSGAVLLRFMVVAPDASLNLPAGASRHHARLRKHTML